MKIFCPNAIVTRVQEIPLKDLQYLGIRGLLIDLDNTLIRWDRTEIDEDVKRWLKQAHDMGFFICFVSNGLKERVRRFSTILGYPAVGRAVKPRRGPFRHALKLLQLSPSEAAVVGDQLFTDVLGGNRMGMYTILINPLSDKELRSTRLVRRLERRMLLRLARQGLVNAGHVESRMKAGNRR